MARSSGAFSPIIWHDLLTLYRQHHCFRILCPHEHRRCSNDKVSTDMAAWRSIFGHSHGTNASKLVNFLLSRFGMLDRRDFLVLWDVPVADLHSADLHSTETLNPKPFSVNPNFFRCNLSDFDIRASHAWFTTTHECPFHQCHRPTDSLFSGISESHLSGSVL